MSAVKNTIAVVLTLSIPVLACRHLLAQSYLVHTYSENDGLGNSTVYDIAQDSLGRMWFATRNGVSLYDGIDFHTFGLSDGLLEKAYCRLCIDEEKAWVLPLVTDAPISFYEANGWSSLPPLNGDAEMSYSCFEVITIAGEPLIAVGTTRSALFLFFEKRWRHITSADGLMGDAIHCILPLNGRLYIATDKGISILDHGRIDNSFNERYTFPSPEIAGMTVEYIPVAGSRIERIWLAGRSWLGYIEGGQFTLLTAALQPSLDPSLYLQADLQGGVFFGNPYDLFHFDARNGVVHLGRESGLISEGATSIFADRERNIWISSLRGVSKIPSLRFANYRGEHGLLEDEVCAIAEVQSGTLVFGHNNGLTYFDGSSFKKVPLFADPLAGDHQNRILDLAADSRRNVWAAASMHGAVKVGAHGSITCYGEDAGLTGSVASVLVDKNDRVWVADHGGLHLLVDDKFTHLGPFGFPERRLRKIAFGPCNSLLAATSRSGVYLYNKGDWSQYFSAHEGDANNVFSLYADSSGCIWVGTLAGLYCVDGDSLVKYSQDGFEINRPVYLITGDGRGNLWFGTDNGVIKWGGGNWRTFTVKEGFVGREVNRSAGIVVSAGRLWIGADLGVSCYRSEFDYSSELPPPGVRLKYMEVADRKLDPHSVHRLAYDANNIVFYLNGISFIDESGVHYRCKLEGFETEWTVVRATDGHSIRYTNLPPGNYKFYLQAINSQGSASPVIASEDILISKPLWGQGWFVLLSLAFFVCIVLGIYSYFLEKKHSSHLARTVEEKTLRLQKSLEEKEVLLKEIHHRVKNNMQVISSMLRLHTARVNDREALEIFRESQHRVKSMALIHEKLYGSKDLAKVELGEYIDNLTQFLFRSYGVDGSLIGFNNNVSGVQLAIDKAIPCGLILNELVSNALKHAFPDGKKGEITIDFEAHGPTSVLTVSDTGVGFPKDVDFRQTETLGLQLVTTLISQLYADIELHNGRAGTTFKISFLAQNT